MPAGAGAGASPGAGAGRRSRRWSGEWGARRAPDAPRIDVLIPSAGRAAELAVTLSGLAGQDDPPFRVIVSDQSHGFRASVEPSVQGMVRVLRAQGREVEVVAHLPRRGIAEHRASLLARATADAVLFLDDDVWLEPGMLRRMHDALETLDIGFVGAAVQGLSYLDDRRVHEAAAFTPWGDAVEPERIRRGTPGFDRWPLHNAANLAHIAADLDLEVDTWLAYRIAWVGGCVLYRRDALVGTGGFDFWERLPERHSGEDVAAQWRVMERFGGAGIVPSGAVHLEAPTTLPVREVDAFDVLFAEEPPEPPVAHESSDPQEEHLGDVPPEESTRSVGGADLRADRS